ncbi:MAG: aminotransferase DegT [Deltaproteobacteria bacterium RBG_13_43_22]|nr:MAG: aminotransferase DegT [Deltaproteobacteria bacterium RBG_13_43_22]
MNTIPKTKRLFLSPPHMGREEFRFIREAFESNYIAPLGPMVDAFEQEFAGYVGIKHCVALSSGTAAMHLALRHLGIGRGDEVFTSTLTFIGSISPVTFLGATPVFIDCDRKTGNMDPVLLERELDICAEQERLPRVVVPTDLYGHCCDYERILALCERYGIPVVMDAAEAMGSCFKSEIGNPKSEIWNHAGVGAKAAVFSFNGNKIITTSGGGMLASDDEELIEHARKLSQQARDLAPHYEHTEIGYNYRMSNVLAAIGRGQLKILNERVEKKRQIFNYYQENLGGVSGIEFMPEASYGISNRWLTVILVTPKEFGVDRETVRMALEEENVESRPIWKPMHSQPVFEIDTQSSKLKVQSKDQRRYKARVVGGEVAEDLFERGLCLPSGTQMTEGDLDRVVKVIKKCRKSF